MPDVEGAPRAGPVISKGRHLLPFVIVAVVAAAASGAGVYVYTQYTTHLTVTGINWQIFVNNTSMGYLFHGESAGCEGQCPSNAQVNSVWLYALLFPFASAEYNLTVVNVTMPPPFQVLGTSPPTPIELAGVGFSTSFRVAIQLPPNPGSYSVLGTIRAA